MTGKDLAMKDPPVLHGEKCTTDSRLLQPEAILNAKETHIHVYDLPKRKSGFAIQVRHVYTKTA
jgi:hypothetical protein